MNVTFVIYNFDPALEEPQQFYNHLQHNLLSGVDPLVWGIEKINMVCRAGKTADHRIKDINLYLRKDEFPPILRWHQRPEEIFSLVKELNPDVIHAFSLGLPLHYRWLRKLLGPSVRLAAHHTGEHHWIQMKLWMQQFGLRVVDGFVFYQPEDALTWLKSAIILPTQRVISMKKGQNVVHRDRVIPNLYQELIHPLSI